MPGMSRLAAICLALAAAGAVTVSAVVVAPAQAPRRDVTDSAALSQPPFLVGKVIHVYDGDTIQVRLDSGPVIVRLHSIDTPEHDQPWGKQAASALARRVQGRQVSLAVVAQDSYERLVADVFVGQDNLNAWMVQQGNAWAYRHYLADAQFCTWEAEARAGGLGLWGQPPASWHAPWQWRAKGRGEPVVFTDYSGETAARCIAEAPATSRPVLPVDAPSRPGAAGAAAASPAMPPRPGDCLIKGNISSSGRIYHLPGSDSYDATRIDESRGERWFCTEAEARAAGWRPPAR